MIPSLTVCARSQGYRRSLSLCVFVNRTEYVWNRSAISTPSSFYESREDSSHHRAFANLIGSVNCIGFSVWDFPLKAIHKVLRQQSLQSSVISIIHNIATPWVMARISDIIINGLADISSANHSINDLKIVSLNACTVALAYLLKLLANGQKQAIALKPFERLALFKLAGGTIWRGIWEEIGQRVEVERRCFP